jgi:cell division septal protein FtsQ
MTGIAAPADRRFRRAQVKPARARRGWTARAIPALRAGLVMTVLGYGAYAGSGRVAQAHVLTVDRIVVVGNQRLAHGEVLALLSGLRGESLVWTDLDRWQQRLMASPWVREATLRRSLPSTVEVVISEWQPIAIGRLHDDMYLIDERGAVIEQYGPQYADLDLPIVDGLASSAAAEESAADAARAQLAARVIAALAADAEVAGRVSQIDVGDLRNAEVILSGDPAVIALGDDRFLARLRSYLELASALRERVNDIDYVDVRFDNRIYVRPRQE